jgi:hypothetical protein
VVRPTQILRQEHYKSCAPSINADHLPFSDDFGDASTRTCFFIKRANVDILQQTQFDYLAIFGTRAIYSTTSLEHATIASYHCSKLWNSACSVLPSRKRDLAQNLIIRIHILVCNPIYTYTQFIRKSLPIHHILLKEHLIT